VLAIHGLPTLVFVLLKTLIQYAIFVLLFKSLELPSLWTVMMLILAQSSSWQRIKVYYR